MRQRRGITRDTEESEKDEENFRRKSRRTVHKASGSRGAYSEAWNTSEDGVICTLSETHSLVDGTVGVDTVVMITKRFEFDTGAGFNLIGC